MAREFEVGIDWLTAGHPARSGYKFVSKSGNNANTWTDPETPKADIYGQAVAGDVVVIGSGLHSIGGNMNFRVYLLGDYKPILVGTGTNIIGTLTALADSRWDDVILRNFLTVYVPGYYDEYYPALGGAWRILFDQCATVDLNHARCYDSIFKDISNKVDSVDTSNAAVKRCAFFNCQVYHNNATYGLPTQFYDNYLHTDTTLHLHASYINNTGFNCIIRGQIEVGGVTYANLAALRVVYPAALPGCQDIDILLLGDPSKYEFTVSELSPIIGAAKNGQNIGGLKAGVIQNADTEEFGFSPAVTGATAFVSDSLQLTAGTSSYRETDIIDLGRLVKSPTITRNGLADYINHVLDSNNALINPNHLCFDAQWAGKDGVFNGTWKSFKFGRPMYQNTDGKTTGESGFVWSDNNELGMRYIKVRIYVRDDYNEA